jgi:hypothetical protein
VSKFGFDLSVIMEEIDDQQCEMESNLNVFPMLHSQNVQDNSSSSDEFSLSKMDSAKKVTLVSLNEKLMGMWDFLQQQNQKQKRKKVKLAENIQAISDTVCNVSEKVSHVSECQSELKQSVQETQNDMKQSQVELKETLQSHTNKMHETLKVQTQAVFAAIQNQNQKIEEELVNQKAYIDDHLKVQKEESSMRLQKVEDTLDKIDTSLSEHEKVLTETSSRLLNLENNRARDKTHNADVNKTLDKFCEKFAEQKKTNQQFENELNKVQSCSKSMESQCNGLEISLCKLSRDLDDKVRNVQEELHDEMKDQFDEFQKKIERKSIQIQECSLSEAVPPAERWDKDDVSDSDTDDRVESFHRNFRRNRSFSCTGNIPWGLDDVVNDSSVSHKIVSENSDESVHNQRKSSNHVRFDVPFSDALNDKNVFESLPKSFSEEVDMNRRNEIPVKDDDQSDLNVFARMMNRIVSRTNNVQLPIFDGVNVDLEGYKRQCLAVAKQNEWNSVDLAIRIVSSLQGDARNLMTLLPIGHEYNLDSIWNILKSRFDRPFSPEVAKNQLANLQQKRGETFLHLSLQIEKLIDKAYPLANEPMRQQLLLDHFIKSIASSAVRYEVRLKNPRDISYARQMAEEISTIQNSEKFQRMTYVNKISCKDRDEEIEESCSDDEIEKKKRKKKSNVQINDAQKNPRLHSQGEVKILENEKCSENVKGQTNEHGTFQNFRNIYHRPNARNYQNNFQNQAFQNSKRNFRNERVDDRPGQPYQQRHIPQQNYNQRQSYQDGRRRDEPRNVGWRKETSGIQGRETQRNDQRGGYGTRGRRGRSGWFNRDNLRNLYYGDESREAKVLRTQCIVSH